MDALHPSTGRSPGALLHLGQLALLLCALAGCGASAGNLRAPADAPNFGVDVAASEVKLINGTNADEVRNIGASALNSLVVSVGRKAPARFSAIVTTETGIPAAAIFYCYIPTNLVAALFCPNVSVSVSVELVLETGGRVYKGQGEDSFIDTATSNALPDMTDDWRAIVHNAFQAAMMNALENAKAGPSKTSAKR